MAANFAYFETIIAFEQLPIVIVCVKWSQVYTSCDFFMNSRFVTKLLRLQMMIIRTQEQLPSSLKVQILWIQNAQNVLLQLPHLS